jgi:DNA-binding beta-propeller fold protein YncE
MKNRSLSLSLITVAILSACGGGSAPVATGIFVDAPVEGLSYSNGWMSGTTDASGRFSYTPGSNVTFSLGGIAFPPVAGAAMVTPVDLVSGTGAQDPAAVAIARLLQSADADGNPSNGIQLDNNKLAKSAKAPANWALASDSDLTALLSGSTSLKSESAARQHMSEQLAVLGGQPRMSLVGRYTSGGTVAVPSLVAEIVAFHAGSKSLFVTVDTAAEPSSFARIDLSALPTTALANSTTATNLTAAPRVNVATSVNGGGFTAGGVQSLDVSGNLLAIAVQSSPKTNAGVIAFYSLDSAGTATYLKKVTVGSLPDGVAFSPDGKYLVVANEGELSTTFMTDGIDPEGSISIIPITNGVPADTTTTLGFADFNVGGSRRSELPAGVRIGRPGATVAQDIEPEYVSISADSKTAFVTLQENNAVAVVDLGSGKISKIFALGYKDYSSKNRIAASDRYAGTTSTVYNSPTQPAQLKNYSNLFGVYMPDGIATVTINGKTYFLTANEGDDRGDFMTGASAETARFADLVASLDATAFPTATVDAIKTAQELGRLTLMAKDANGKFGDTDGDGDYDRLYVLGGRSFSIWDAETGLQVFDSGDDVERIVYNNAADDATKSAVLLKADQLLGRLDNKGPEPESVVVGQVGSETYAFVALERASAILMYQITNPLKPKFVQHIRNTTDLTDGDISPEGLKFIPAAQSPNGVALLVVGHEVTGSVAVYQIK